MNVVLAIDKSLSQTVGWGEIYFECILEMIVRDVVRKGELSLFAPFNE